MGINGSKNSRIEVFIFGSFFFFLFLFSNHHHPQKKALRHLVRLFLSLDDDDDKMAEKVVILGSGLIGRCWATLFARAGYAVVLFDIDPNQV